MSRKDSQRQMDEEILILERRALELKIRRNALADVAMLPRELLVEIFLLVQADLDVKEWHQVAHVCRHWRDTALNAPILWTEPPTYSHDYTNLMLGRSGRAKLSISMDHEKPASTATLQSIVNHADRTHALTLDIHSAQLEQIFDLLVKSGVMLSQLQSLDIEDSGSCFSIPYAMVPSNFFPDSSPLSTLRLWQVSFNWQVLTSLDLTSLELMHFKLAAKISAPTLLNTLRNMPRLESLCFTTDHFLLTSDDIQKVSLPHLRHLCIDDFDHAHISYLLPRLELPSLEELSLDTYAEDERVLAGYSPNMLAPIPKALAGGKFHVGGKLVVDSTAIRAIAVDDPFLNVTLSVFPDNIVNAASMQFLVRQIVPLFHGLTEVDLSYPLESDVLVEIFGSLKLLTSFAISRYESLVPALANALTSRASDRTVHAFASLDAVSCRYDSWSDLTYDEVTDFCGSLRQLAAQTKLVVRATLPLPMWISKLLKAGGIEVKDL